MDYPLLLHYLKCHPPFFSHFPAKEIACSICLNQSIKYLRNNYRYPYIYIVFTTGWHFMPNILPRAVARGKMKA